MHSALLQRPLGRALSNDDLDSTLDMPHSSAFILTDPTTLSSSAPDYDGLPPLSPIFPSLDHTSTVSSSPAAMFLSAFSPTVSAAPLPDDEGEQVDGYKLGPIIGFGGFSSIRRAFSPSGGTVAVKIVRRSDLEPDSPQARERLENEASIWHTLSHEHILPLFHTVHTPYADFFFMLFCPAGTLYDILKRDGRPALPHDDAGMMFRQVVRGVRYLHEQMALVHADLKLENVLVDEMGVCRICDFGMTRSFGEEEDIDGDLPALPSAPHGLRNHRSIPDSARLPRTSSLLRSGRGSLKATGHLSHLIHQHSRPRRRESTPLPTHPQSQAPHLHAVYEFPPGSLPYASPELLRRPDADRPYRPHPAQDIWALGVMLYALLTGGLPFVDSFEPRLTMKILHGAFDMPKNVGRGAELVLRGCLEASVPQRWTIAAVDDRMNSSNSSKWFTRPTHKLRGTDHHARGLVPAPTHLLSFLITTPPVTTLFRSWNTIPSPWAALRSRVPPRRAAAARVRSRPSHTHGPKSKCRLPSAHRNSRCWGPRPCTRRRRLRPSSATAAEVTTRQNAARGAGRRHWVFRARAARAWRLYRRRSRRCADDRAWPRGPYSH
ncbi:kinase-like domain-containing protein [Lactarius sanguifluus]|nr:kinase-like domain-containing protein [Lactarius sanguifluus]